jgi:hypothetical protein
MPKQKTSASSATRKKHARKQAAKGAGEGSDDEKTAKPVQPNQRGQKKDKKSKKNEPKVKAYVPPTKPKGAADPVDLYGLGLAGDLQVCHMLIISGIIKLMMLCLTSGLSSEAQQERRTYIGSRNRGIDVLVLRASGD